MPTDIRIIHAHEFIRATVDGQLDFETSRRLLVEIASVGAPLGDYEVMLDTRKAQSGMSETDLWYLAVELCNLRKAFSRRTAVLCPPEGFDSAAFFTLCAQNQGFAVKPFTSLP